MKAMGARALEAHKANQEASDRDAMKDFIQDLDDDSDEEEMREWIAEQKARNYTEADRKKDAWDARMKEEEKEAIMEARAEEEFSKQRARIRLVEAKKLAAIEEEKQINKVYAKYAQAMRQGKFDTVYDMVSKVGISVNWEDTYGNTAIIVAAKFGLKVPIDRLLLLGADVNQENQFGRTPLIEACRGGYGNIVQHLLVDPENPNELRSEANAKNRFGKTASDYAIAAGHGKKILPLLNTSIAKQLKIAKDMGFDINEDDYKMATDFNIKDAPRKARIKKRKKKSNSVFAKALKTLGLESKKTIARLHKLRDESARKIQGMVRMRKARQTMDNRLRDIVIAAHRAHLMERKKAVFIVRIQRGYRLKLARRYWRQRIVRYKASTKIISVVRMFVARCFYHRHISMKYALIRMDQAATMIQCLGRQMKAKILLYRLKRNEACARKIQHFSKIVKARRKARHKRWERDRHKVLDKLYRTAIEIKYVVVFDELKDELVAMKVIHKWARALLFNWSQRVDWESIKLLRGMEATKIQNCAREWMSRRLFRLLRKKRDTHLEGLPSVLSVRKLKGSGNHAYSVGSPHKYGYCTGCDCEKFRPPENGTGSLMCGCGHFITRHVIGYFRDPRYNDYYEKDKKRKKLMGRSFSSATGITENFDLVMKMKPNDLRKSLMATQSVPPTVEGIETIKDPAKAARVQYLAEEKLLKKRKERAKRAKLFDPIRLVGAIVPILEHKNPIKKLKNQKKAKKKLNTTIARNLKLEHWKKEAEEFTGQKITDVEFNRVSELYRERDESPSKKTQQNLNDGTTQGAILWRVPGAKPLMKPSQPLKMYDSPTLSLIEQLEREIENTKKKAEKHRRNINQIQKDERQAKKDARIAKKEYENSATVLLLKHRLQTDIEETTHEKLIGHHTSTVDLQKETLMKELNRISRKAYGLDDEDEMNDAEEAAVMTGMEKIEEIESRSPETKASKTTKTTKTTRRKADALMGSLTESAMKTHTGKEMQFAGATEETKDRNKHRQRKKDVEEIEIIQATSGGKRGIRNKTSKRKNKRHVANPGKPSKKRNQKEWNSNNNNNTPSAPTSDMVMSALKGMLKGIQNPERTKNRWIRTPETETNGALNLANQKNKRNARNKTRNKRPIFSDDDDQDDDNDNDYYEDDFETTVSSPPPPVGFRNEKIKDEMEEEGMGKADHYLDQRAETPLVHVAWRQSHAARAPVVFLHLVDNGGSNGNETKNKDSRQISNAPPKTIALRTGRTFIGRDGRSCDVMLDSFKQPKMISKIHACFWVTRKGNKWTIECADCNSTNGTFVNGKRVSSNGRKRLAVGTTVLFGKRSRRQEQRSELLYVLTDDSIGGGDIGSRNYLPPQSPLHKERNRKRETKRNTSNGLEQLNGEKQDRNEDHQRRRRRRRQDGNSTGKGLESLNGETKNSNGRSNGRAIENASSMKKLDDDDDDKEDEHQHQQQQRMAKRSGKVQRSSSMTELDPSPHRSSRTPPRRIRSSLSRERAKSPLSRERIVSPFGNGSQVQQEENFNNMMAELNKASEMLRRPPTTPLRKKRSSLSRGGGIRRDSVENPGMMEL